MFLNINPKYKYTVVTTNGKQIYKIADWSIAPESKLANLCIRSVHTSLLCAENVFSSEEFDRIL